MATRQLHSMSFASNMIRVIRPAPVGIYKCAAHYSQVASWSRPCLNLSKLQTLDTRTLSRIDLRSLTTETRTAIDQAIASKPVVLFMKGTPDFPQCGFSKASIQILGLEGVDPGKFAAFNVLESNELRGGIKEYSDWPTIPQLYVQKNFVGGYDILSTMHKSGELTRLLEDNGAVVQKAP